MDLRQWIVADHASTASRFERGVLAHVPEDRWRERAGGGSCIAWLVFHATYHEDLAVAGVVRGRDPLLLSRRGALGLRRMAPHHGLGETELPELSEALALDELLGYSRDVHAATASWLASMDLASLDQVPPASARLEELGVSAANVPWLHQMWEGSDAGSLVRWEAIGHVHNHVGEMISVRSRLGLSPF